MIEQILNLIIAEVSKMPTFYKLISLVIILFFVAYFTKKDFRNLVNDFYKKIIAICSTNYLGANELFHSEKSLLNQINLINLSDDTKENLFKILLKNKVKATISLSMEFLKKFNELKKMVNVEIKFMSEELIYDIKKKYEEDTLNDYIKIYGDLKGRKIFEYVYTKGFEPRHENNIEFIRKAVNSILLSKVKTIEIRLYNLFSLFYIALETAISECETVFEKFNGELEKIIKS